MSKMADMTIGIDSFFTESRLVACYNIDCRFNSHKQGAANCIIKRIIVGSDGKCIVFEPKKGEKESNDGAKSST